MTVTEVYGGGFMMSRGLCDGGDFVDDLAVAFRFVPHGIFFIMIFVVLLDFLTNSEVFYDRRL